MKTNEIKQAADVICIKIDEMIKMKKVKFPTNYYGVDYILDPNASDGIAFLFDIGFEGKYAQVSFRMGKLKDAVVKGQTDLAALAVLNSFQKYYEQGHYDGKIQSISPIRNNKPAVGRNELCPCGSGKKYKKCCFYKNASLPASEISGNSYEVIGPCLKCKISYPQSLAIKAVISGECSVLFKECDCGNGYILCIEPDSVHFRYLGLKNEVYNFYKNLPWEEENHINEDGKLYPHKAGMQKEAIIKYLT